jgi:hypothetical protein
MNDEPRSEWMKPGIPHNEKIESRDLMTVDAEMSGHGMIKGKREYSSTTVRIYLFLDDEGNGPLKSILIRSMGRVDLINVWFLLL